MSDDSLNSARLHLSEAAELAGTMAGGIGMKRLRKALNRCNPINQHPAQPPAPYAENSFEGNNVGQPAQVPQYSQGSYPGGPVDAAPAPPPLPVTEYPGDTIPPALPDPCADMKHALASCAPTQYCPSFMGQPTQALPLAGQPQPLDTYDSFTNQPLNGLGDPNRSLNDTLRQLWLRNHLQERTQANQYVTAHKPKGPGGGQFTEGGSSGSDSSSDTTHSAGGQKAIKMNAGRLRKGDELYSTHENHGGGSWKKIAEVTHDGGYPGITRFKFEDGTGLTTNSSAELSTRTPSQQNSTQNSTQNSAQPYSYPQNPDGRIQGPMQEIPEGDFLGGKFGPGIKRMREQLRNCRSC